MDQCAIDSARWVVVYVQVRGEINAPQNVLFTPPLPVDSFYWLTFKHLLFHEITFGYKTLNWKIYKGSKLARWKRYLLHPFANWKDERHLLSLAAADICMTEELSIDWLRMNCSFKMVTEKSDNFTKRYQNFTLAAHRQSWRHFLLPSILCHTFTTTLNYFKVQCDMLDFIAFHNYPHGLRNVPSLNKKLSRTRLQLPLTCLSLGL